VKNPFRTKYRVFFEDEKFYVARKCYWYGNYWSYVGLSSNYEETLRIIEEDKCGNWPPKPKRILVSEHE
jgi:hypothetical protein